MEKKIEVLKQNLSLAQTGLEGLEHIQKRTMAGHFEETTYLFSDVFDGVNEIQKAIQSVISDLEHAELPSTASLLEGFKLMLAAYNKEENMRPLEILQFTLIPRYQKWQSELEQLYAAHTSS